MWHLKDTAGLKQSQCDNVTALTRFLAAFRASEGRTRMGAGPPFFSPSFLFGDVSCVFFCWLDSVSSLFLGFRGFVCPRLPLGFTVNEAELLLKSFEECESAAWPRLGLRHSSSSSASLGVLYSSSRTS